VKAALLAGAAQTHRYPAFTSLDELRRACLIEVEAVLGTDTVAELMREGRTLTLEHAIDLIAGALVISIRTAEGHVQRILGKLGFVSRSQIAVWVTEQRAQGRTGSPSLTG
jgi:non-specific serine/threonine protein kinase